MKEREKDAPCCGARTFDFPSKCRKEKMEKQFPALLGKALRLVAPMYVKVNGNLK